MINFLLIPLIILFFALAWRSRILALAVLIVLLPSYGWRFNFFGLPSSLLELMFLVLFAVWFFDRRETPLRGVLALPKNWRLWLAAWLAVSLMALMYHFNFSSLGLWRAYFLEPILFSFLVLDLARLDSAKLAKGKKNRAIIFNSFAVLILFLSVVALYQYFTDWRLPAAYNYPNIKRLTAVFSYPNAVTLLVAPLLAFLFAYIFELKNTLSSWNRGAILLNVLAGTWLVLMTKSEAAILALACALFIFVFFKLKTKWQQGFFLGLALYLVFFSALKNYFLTAFNDLFHPAVSHFTSSLAIRGLQWQETLLMLKEHWFFGAGLNGYQTLFAQYHQITWLEIFLYPHNIFLNFWVELGILGLLLFLVFIYLITKDLKQLFLAKHYLAWPLSLSWLVVFVQGLVDAPYFKNDLSLLFFLLLSLTIVSTQDEQN